MRALVLALALWAGAAEAQVRTDPAGLREIAVGLLVQGEAGRSAELARALLARDPDDRTALVVLAAAAPQVGRAAEGRRAAERAWALSESRAERFEAARLAARAAVAEERPFLAEFWLRLALATAPDAEQEARTLADARALRARNPWRLDVDLGFAPSDNVNGGASTDRLEVDGVVIGLPGGLGLSIDAQALSGWVGTFDLRAARRLRESRTERTELRFRLSGRAVVLSRESKERIREEDEEDGTIGDELEEITGSDFGSAAAEMGIGHRRLLDWGVAGGDATLGWSRADDGEDPLDPLEDAPVYSLRLSGFSAHELTGGQSLRLSGSVEERRSEDDARDQRRLGADLAWTAPVRDEDRLTLAVSRNLVLSDNRNQASEGWGLRASYALGEAVGPARLSFTAGASWTDFPDYAFIAPIPGGRQDRRVYARAEAVFEDWSFAGFAPVLSLDAARTESSVSRFDTESFGVGVSLRSTF